MIREKYNLIQELQKKNEDLVGKKRLTLIGQGDFVGGNNVMRGTMNIKHHTQHLTINNPEFPFVFDGKENITGENSSYHNTADKDYTVIGIAKKYNELMKGKTNFALYFIHSKEDDSYRVIERKEVEDLTENFGFKYNNEYLDSLEIGDTISKGDKINSSTSYDDYGNVAIGVNGRIMNAVHPAVQDDAIIIRKSFAERVICNDVSTKTIPISETTILLNKYGKDGEYRGLPNIGDVITDGIICATRPIKENRMFSDLREISLKHINGQLDTVFYGNGEVIDINVYCNKPDMKINKVNKQVMQYYNDARWFYTEVYKMCKKIIKSGSKNISSEIYRWKKTAMKYLDTQAVWAFNDNIFSNIMVEIVMKQEEPMTIGRKIVG